jgi:hypothetical protein
LVQGPLVFHFCVNGAPEGSTARLIKNGEGIAFIPLHDEQDSYQFEDFLEGSPCWYRLDVTDQSGHTLAVSNPVYAGPRREQPHRAYVDLMFAG